MKIRDLKTQFDLPLIILLLVLGSPLFAQSQTENLQLKENTAFASYEDLSSPKFYELRNKFKLDTIFHGEEDELKRMLLLRDWIRKVIQISDFESSYPGEGYPEIILEKALNGQGFHCGHYMTVQNAILNSYGYVTRCLGAGPGRKEGPYGHHGANEIWSNKFRKWFLSDAKYNHHFEKNGIPLSALEVRDEFLKNKAADITLVKGINRLPIKEDEVRNSKGEVILRSKSSFAQTYTWIEWDSLNNRYTNWPENSHELNKLNMFADEYFKKNIWIWDGKPHWAYNTKFMILVSNRDAIEWTPNTIRSEVKIIKDNVRVSLYSITPNLKTYQMKLPGSEWKNVPSTIDVTIEKDVNELMFRAVNLAGVCGPEHKVKVK